MNEDKIEKHLDRALSEDRFFTLPENFTDQVMRKVAVASSSDRKLIVLIWGTTMIMVFAGIASMMYLYQSGIMSKTGDITEMIPGVNGPEDLSLYGGYLVVIVVFVAFFQYLDKKIIRKPNSNSLSTL